MKDRVICEYYICKGNCSKGRDADYNGYCKHCNKWSARKGTKLVNKKKDSKRKGEL